MKFDTLISLFTRVSGFTKTERKWNASLFQVNTRARGLEFFNDFQARPFDQYLLNLFYNTHHSNNILRNIN